MPYFDITQYPDRDFLHATIRDDERLPQVAEQVEYDVIDHYREDTHTGMQVMLKGYDEDPAEAEVNLKEALKRTIADVVSHRLLRYDDEDNVQSESLGNRSTTYRKKSNWQKSNWQKGWDSRLIKYDLREVAWYV